MSSKLLSAARKLLDDRAVEGNPVIIKDEACHTWLRDTPLKALHPNRQAQASCIIPCTYTVSSFYRSDIDEKTMLMQPRSLLGGAQRNSPGHTAK